MEGRKHSNEPIVWVRQRKDAEGIKESDSIGDAGKEPVEVVLTDALYEEIDDLEEGQAL